ncbi:phosphoglycerate mutase-like protein [Whalleya microplaca]|nr:phosphoglycerate mutase-like protein [Whalleya microplaca]
MRTTTVVALLSLTATSLSWEWAQGAQWNLKLGSPSNSTMNYTTIAGFFQQDDPATDAKNFDYTESNFGLIERAYPTDDVFDPRGEKTQWERFENYVNALNRNATKDTQYKVLFMGRHGEGYHNAAESYYGTPAWNCYWGLQDGNGTSTWRDARLTEAGIAQCSKAASFWANALSASKIPAPQTYYSSPLTRSATTANLTFGALALPADRPFAPTVKELLREGISPRTCDERPDRAALQALLPHFRFEDGFAEVDPLWRAGEGETDEAMAVRTKRVLDDIFGNDQSTWVSITTHSGQITQSLKVLGHIPFSLTTGQAIPVLVRAERRGGGEPATTTGASRTAEATCGNPPVTSVSGQGCVCSSASSSTLASATATTTPA